MTFLNQLHWSEEVARIRLEPSPVSTGIHVHDHTYGFEGDAEKWVMEGEEEDQRAGQGKLKPATQGS